MAWHGTRFDVGTLPFQYVHMAYQDIEPPDDKPYPEYSPTERRAYIFDQIVEQGHPKLVNRSALAEQFDVSNSVITRDINTHIADEIGDQLGNDAELLNHAVFNKAIREMMEEDEYGKAVRFLSEWNEFLFESGALERAPDKAEIQTQSVSTEVDSDELDEETMAQLDQLRDASRDEVHTGGADGLDADE